MTGYDYENFVAAYLQGMGFYNIYVTQASNDYGVDVLATKDNLRFAVQCKYYSGHVGVSAIQEVTAGKAMYNCDGAMVVTNSSYTKAAQALARKNNVILLDCVVPGAVYRPRNNLTVKSSNIKSKWQKLKLWLLIIWAAFGLLIAYFAGVDILDIIKGVKPFTRITATNILYLLIYLGIPFYKKIVVNICKYIKNKITSHSPQKRTQAEVNKELEYFKSNFSILTKRQKKKYANDIAFTISTLTGLYKSEARDTDIAEFLTDQHLIELTLKTLCEHSYLGWMQNPTPNERLDKELSERYLHEIDFIDRIYGRTEALRMMDDPVSGRWFDDLDSRTIDYIKTGERPANEP